MMHYLRCTVLHTSKESGPVNFLLLVFALRQTLCAKSHIMMTCIPARLCHSSYTGIRMAFVDMGSRTLNLKDTLIAKSRVAQSFRQSSL
jgi:hypothetical protein